VESNQPCFFHIYVVKEGRVVCDHSDTSDWWIRDDWFWKLPDSGLSDVYGRNQATADSAAG